MTIMIHFVNVKTPYLKGARLCTSWGNPINRTASLAKTPREKGFKILTNFNYKDCPLEAADENPEITFNSIKNTVQSNPLKTSNRNKHLIL